MNPEGGLNNVVTYTPGAPGGVLSISDDLTGVITLDVNSGGAPLTNFGGTGTGNISLQLGSVLSTASITFVHETNTALNQVFSSAQVVKNANLSFAAGSNSYSHIQFTSTTGNAGYFLQIQSLTASITCYLEGTGIATPTGCVAVEDLRPGDEILTADGRTTTVNWLGIQHVDTKTATPAKANPICFVAG